MKQTLKETSLALALLSATLASASAATNLLPQLAIKSMGPAEVRLYWPASASDFVLEETRELTAFGLWLPVTSEPTLSGQDYTVKLASAEHARFYRLRYQPSALRSPNPAISFAFGTPDGTNVVLGQPFAVEVRASLNAILAAAAVRLSASGLAEAMLTGRSADPAQLNGLMFVSAASQQPFESGLPASLGGKGSLEVLLGTGTWPFDGVQPGEDVLLERLEITPMTSGELTISLAAVEAVTSRWVRNGVPFETVSLDPWRSAVTVLVQGAAQPAGLGTTVDVRPAAESAGVRPLRIVESFRQQAQAAATITPNADGQSGVDLADLVYVRARLGLDPGLPENAGADVNQDKQIDLLDLVAVRNRFSSPAGFGERPAPRLNEVAPHPAAGQAPWVELSYPRWVEPYFYALELRNGAQEVLLRSWPEAISTWVSYIVIVFDGPQPMEFLGDSNAPTVVRLHLPQLGVVFNSTNDQCLLYLDGELVDSVAWGKQPERNTTLNTGMLPIPLGGSIGRDGLEQERWVRFTQPTPGADNGLPTPLACFPFDGAGVLQGKNTRFAWVDPRYSPVTYEIEVDDAEDFQTPLIRATCYQPSYTHAPGLAPGKYFWRLRAQAGEVAGPWSAPAGFEVMELPLVSPQARLAAQSVPLRPAAPPAMPSTYVIPWFENNKLLGPRKDTTMVCLECDQETGIHAWDKPHGTPQEIQANSVGLCPHEIGHAATAIAVTLNRFYGGDLTQDELNYAVFTGTGAGGQPEGNLGHGAVANLEKALPAALGTWDLVFPDGLDPFSDDIFYERLRNYISGGTPGAAENLWVQQGQSGSVRTGPVVIYGYVQAKDLSGNETTLLIAAGPFIGQGAVIRRESLKVTPYVYFPGLPPGQNVTPAKSDPDLRRDTDGDGLCDLDELARFATEEGRSDSDGDGIPDKTEVWSYKFGKGWVPRTPDPDGDGERAETDPDTDGDGCLDGQEDRNHNGTLITSWLYQSMEPGGIGIPMTSKDADESDPFWGDEFKVTLTAERTTLHFKECTRVEVKVTDKSDDPVKNAEVQFKMEPLIASFDASGGTPVSTALELTDKDGKAATDFCAQETEGTVTVTALYKPCPDGKESRAELKIQILPYDWIFAVQEKAVLTGPVVTVDYRVRDTSTPGFVSAAGYQEAKESVGFQSVKGHFYHPKTQNPGRYIDQVTVVGVPPGTTPELRIDGLPFQSLVWTRTNQLQAPKTWEVRIADYNAGFPRFLEVVAGGQRRTTPLVWWRTHLHKGYRERERVGAGPPFRVLRFDWVWHTYAFFFGDTRDGYDISGPQNTWPTNSHTLVSFIPRTTVGGYREGTGALGERPTQIRWQDRTGGTFFYYYVFQDDKNWLQYTPPTQWTVTSYDNPPNLVEELRALGPLPEETFLSEIRFERDYIGDELKELQQRKLDPPQYEIRMLTEE